MSRGGGIAIPPFNVSVAQKVAVTGASGFIGRALVPRLREKGFNVRALVRHHSASLPADVEQIPVGDIATADLPPLIDGCRVVINLAARVHVTRETEADPEAADI